MTLQETASASTALDASTASAPFDPAKWIAAVTKLGCPPYVERSQYAPNKGCLMVMLDLGTDRAAAASFKFEHPSVPPYTGEDLDKVVYYLERHIPAKLDETNVGRWMKTMEAFNVGFSLRYDEDIALTIGNSLVWSKDRIENLGKYLRDRLNASQTKAIVNELLARAQRRERELHDEFCTLAFIKSVRAKADSWALIESYWSVKSSGDREEDRYSGQQYALGLLHHVLRSGHSYSMGYVLNNIVFPRIPNRGDTSSIVKGFLSVLSEAANFGLRELRQIEQNVENTHRANLREAEELHKKRQDRARKAARTRWAGKKKAPTKSRRAAQLRKAA